MSTQTAIYQSYASYKDSGVSTIGFIPEYWEKIKVKNAFDFKKIKLYEKEPVVLSLARDGVKIRDISTNEGQIAESYINYNKVDKGDLLLNPMDLYSGANCSISYVEGVISPAYVNLRTKTLFCPEYYDYFFKTLYWNRYLLANGKGVSVENRWTLTNDTLKNIFIPHPPYNEQQKISSFLDKKIIKINKIIRNKKRLIELLQEKRQALITKAVTKGVDLNAKMKDSGVDWIGKIPNGWECASLRSVASNFRNGTSVEQIDEDSGFYVSRIESISLNKINYQKVGYIRKESTDPQFKMNAGDILLSHINSLERVGNCALYEGKLRLYHGMNLIRLEVNNIISPKYLFYFLTSNYFRSKMQEASKHAINQVSVPSAKIKAIKIFYPPKTVQKEITQLLETQISKIDLIVNKLQKEIKKINEYKSALIYNAVTGKIKV